MANTSSTRSGSSGGQFGHEGNKNKGQESGGTMMEDIKDTAGSAMDKAKEFAGSATDKAKEFAGSAVDKAKEFASSAASSVSQRAGDFASAAGDKVEGAVSAVGGGMKSLADTIREQAPREGMLGSSASAVASGLESSGRYIQEEGLSGMMGDVTAVIRRNPIPAVMIGFGLGCLLACAVTSRDDRY